MINSSQKSIRLKEAATQNKPKGSQKSQSSRKEDPAAFEGIPENIGPCDCGTAIDDHDHNHGGHSSLAVQETPENQTASRPQVAVTPVEATVKKENLLPQPKAAHEPIEPEEVDAQDEDEEDEDEVDDNEDDEEDLGAQCEADDVSGSSEADEETEQENGSREIVQNRIEDLRLSDPEEFPSLGGSSKAAPAVAARSWAKVAVEPASQAKERPVQVIVHRADAMTSSASVPLSDSASDDKETAEAAVESISKAVNFEAGSTSHRPEQTSRILRSTGASEYSSAQSNRFRAEEDDGENWINPSNLSSCRITGSGMLGGSRAQGAKNGKFLAGAKVACVTTDFSMENVIIQLGLRLMSVEGRLIFRVKQWVLRCAGCYTIHYDTDRLFCTKCGLNMLQRIAASVDSKTGELKLHLKANYRHNTRGMIHSLPKPGSQGRYDGELLMREDQLLTGIWRQKVAKIKHDVKSAFGEDITQDVGLHINKREFGVKVGLGRRNPNADKGRERRGAKNKKAK